MTENTQTQEIPVDDFGQDNMLLWQNQQNQKNTDRVTPKTVAAFTLFAALIGGGTAAAVKHKELAQHGAEFVNIINRSQALQIGLISVSAVVLAVILGAALYYSQHKKANQLLQTYRQHFSLNLEETKPLTATI